jgi:hypothetical protein
MKSSHAFNSLDARGAISVTERARFIGRVRGMAKACAEAYVASRAKLGFPLLAEDDLQQKAVGRVPRRRGGRRQRRGAGRGSRGVAAVSTVCRGDSPCQC